MLRYAREQRGISFEEGSKPFRFNPQIPLKKWREPLCFWHPMKQLRYMARWWMSPVECWINETEITGIVMSLDTYYTLGRSGLRVSRLALGTMTFGTDWGWGADETARHCSIHMWMQVATLLIQRFIQMAPAKPGLVNSSQTANCASASLLPPSLATTPNPATKRRRERTQEYSALSKVP